MTWFRTLAWLRWVAFLVLLALSVNSSRAQDPQQEEFPMENMKGLEINCGVVSWNNNPQKPVLSMVCPPLEVFAPLYIYMKVTQTLPQIKVRGLGEVLARPKEQIKIRPTGRELMVLLKVLKEGKSQPEAIWVGFDEVVKMGLQPRARSVR